MKKSNLTLFYATGDQLLNLRELVEAESDLGFREQLCTIYRPRYLFVSYHVSVRDVSAKHEP